MKYLVSLILSLELILLSPSVVSATDVTLTPSGKINITADNQVVQNLRITSTDVDSIHCNGYSNIKIQNVVILFNGGHGISLNNCDGATISNVNILFTGASASGPNSIGRNCIDVYNSDNLVPIYLKARIYFINNS